MYKIITCVDVVFFDTFQEMKKYYGIKARSLADFELKLKTDFRKNYDNDNITIIKF